MVRLLFFFQAEDGIRDGHVTGLFRSRTWLPKLGFTAPAGSTIISRPAETEKMLAEWPRAHTPEPSSTHRSSRSEEHTSELQSRGHLVCRLLLEKKKKNTNNLSDEKTT